MLSLSDEPYLQVRSLSIDYSSGAQTGKHRHPWGQLVYCLSGAMRCQLEDVSWVVPPRRGIWLPSAVEHSLITFGEAKLRTLYITNALDTEFHAVRALNISALMHETIIRICQLGALDERLEFHKALRLLVVEEMKSSGSNLRPLPMPTDSRARQLAENFLNVSGAESMLSIMKRVGLTRRTAERLFSEQTGMTPARWYRQARLSVALRNLLEGHSVADVANECGYRSRSAFSRAFSGFHGVNPRDVLISPE